MSQNMYDKVVSVIDQPPLERNNEEINELIPFFLKKSELFKSLKTDVVIDIIRNCIFKRVERDHVLIKQGDKGDCFYIILSGKVAIYINNALADEDNQIGNVDDGSGEKEDDEDQENEFSVFQKKDEEKKKKPLDRSKFGNYIASIDAGKSFGELALINKDCVRNASIVADETTDLVVVDRELYNRSLKAAQLAEFEERNSFVSECPYFSNWQQRFKKQMAMSLVKVRIPYDGCIVKQGEPVEGLFFVIRGQAKVIIDPMLHETQYPTYYPIEECEVQTERNEELEELISLARKKNTSHSDTHKSVDLSKGPPSADVLKRRIEHRRKTLEICVIGPRECVGDVELSLDLPTYMQTVHCIQDTEVYSLDMKNYERLVTRKNPWTVDAMKGSAEIKIESRSLRHDKQMPFLSALMHKILDNRFQKQKQNQPRDDKRNCTETIFPHRGPLIDLFGPGTVFYRNRMREKARREAKRKNFGFQNSSAVSWGLKVAALSGMISTNDDIYEGVSSEGNTNLGLPSLKIICQSGEAQNGTAFLTEQNMDGEDADWETSDSALANLEARIKHWHSVVEKIQPLSARRKESFQIQPQIPSAQKKVVQLRRFQKDENSKIAPGKKVYIRRRKPTNNVAFRRPPFSDGEDDVDHDRSPISNNARNRLTMSDVHACHTSDTDGETDDEKASRNRNRKIKPTSAHCGSRKHIASLRQQSAGPYRKQYTVEEYKILKEHLRQKQKEFTRCLSKLGL